MRPCGWSSRLGALAGCYLVLGAEFVALVQVLVYVGAVVVLVLFALMLTRAPIGPEPRARRRPGRTAGWPPSLGAGDRALLGSVLLPLAGEPVDAPRRRTDRRSPGSCSAPGCWPFELLSLLLLGALVAGVSPCRRPIAGRRPPSDRAERPVIHLAGPYVLAAAARRSRRLRRRSPAATRCSCSIGVELMLNGATLLLVTPGPPAPTAGPPAASSPLFVITIAAAEIGIALAIILAAFRQRGRRPRPSRAHWESPVNAWLVVLVPAAGRAARALRRPRRPAARGVRPSVAVLTLLLGASSPMGGARARHPVPSRTVPGARRRRAARAARAAAPTTPRCRGARRGPRRAGRAGVLHLVPRDDDRYPASRRPSRCSPPRCCSSSSPPTWCSPLVGWEVMGWCSYLLIGHWTRRHSARRAAHKAFLVTRRRRHRVRARHHRPRRRGRHHDTCSVIATGPAARLPGTPRAWRRPRPQRRAPRALLLIVIGVLGKSAQIPFQDWLPDAMEGPTPASAPHPRRDHGRRRHLRAGPAVPAPRRWPTRRAGCSASRCADHALGRAARVRPERPQAAARVVDRQPGRVMLSALAVGARRRGPGAGLFHLCSHAVFKALLFLAIGWIA